jgi:hypothetical protein
MEGNSMNIRRTATAFAVIGGALASILIVLIAHTTPGAGAKSDSSPGGKIHLVRAPNDGIQPQALADERGTTHLVYFAGDPNAGDIFYARRAPGQQGFSSPVRVNSQPGSAVAVGTIRGAQLSVGGNGRVHVSWNGSNNATPRGPEESAPLLYSRMNDAGTAFEPQRNLMQVSNALDGGGSLAADKEGDVYVVWHAAGEQKGEPRRRVWIAVSTDEGKSFAREVPAYREETGACACCGMRAFVDSRGTLRLLYRTATNMSERGMYLLSSTDRGKSFQGARLDSWELTSCPMSSSTMAMDPDKRVIGAWENNGQVYFAALGSPAQKPIPAPRPTGKRKHPAVASNAFGQTLLVWTEGTGWKKGGSLAWQLFDKNGSPIGETNSAPGVPVWGLATAVTEPDGSFSIIY